MRRPNRSDVAVAGGSVVLAGAVALASGSGPPEWLFFGVLFAALGVALRVAVRAWRTLRDERRRAAVVTSTPAGDAARRAVQEERRRLSDDIAHSLRDYVVAVENLAETGLHGEPGVAARLIHLRSQQASSELRRHLGLLRGTKEDLNGRQSEPSTSSAAFPGRRSLKRIDLLTGAAVGALAVAEAVAYRSVESMERGWGAVVLTGLAAAAVTGRRFAPGWSSLGAAAIFLVGAVAGEGIIVGFWVIPAVCGLLWATLAPLRRAALEAGAGVALAAAATAATALTDPDNAGATSIVVSATCLIALVVRLTRVRAGRADRSARDHQAVLDAATRSAVDAERLVFARELHDVVSHAVGLIALQAAAVEVSWEHEPEAAKRSLGIISETARATLAELDRLGPGRPPRARRTLDDMTALIGRIRAAGTPVTIEGLAGIPPEHLDIVYRVVQESLTNVLRHGEGSPVRVRVDLDSDLTRVVVDDEGPGCASEAGRGYGLVGLAERVAFTGGSLQIGPGTDRCGFVVKVALPRRPEPQREAAP